MGVHEDGQLHQAVAIGHDEPLARELAKCAGGVAPVRVVDHDVAGAFGVAKAGQGLRETVADIGQIIRGHIAVAQHQSVVLVGLEQLLATALAAHHKQAAVLHQLGRSHQGPGALEQARIELLYQLGNQVHARAAAVQDGNHAGDLRGGLAQALQVLGVLYALRNHVRLVGQEAEHVERL